MNKSQLLNSFRVAIVAALIVSVFGMFSFFTFEPAASQAAVEIFQVTQQVSGEIAFAASTTDVTMVGTLNGLSGGTAYGTATARVTTNNAGGYNMTLSFSSTTAMIRNGTSLSEMQNYAYSTGTADYPAGWVTTGITAGQFGFTVIASSTGEESNVFTGTAGVNCGTGAGSTFTPYDCWRGGSTTDETYQTEVINTTAPTEASGSTSSVLFRVQIPNNPDPTIPDGLYTATVTLTALDN